MRLGQLTSVGEKISMHCYKICHSIIMIDLHIFFNNIDQLSSTHMLVLFSLFINKQLVVQESVEFPVV